MKSFPLLSWAIISLLFLLAGTFFPLHAEKPNLLLILVDDLGHGDLSCMPNGAKDIRTPHIDALAASGIRCDNFYANCPVCSPTRAALLTGRYQEVVGVPGVIRTHAKDNWGYLHPDAVLLPDFLRPRGYHSAIVGKWHLGLEPENQPTRRGFDFFHGFLGDMMDDYYKHTRFGFHYMRRNEEDIRPEGHATDLFTDWARAYIRERSRIEQPWFLYLAYNAPHTPIQPPPEWVEKVKMREKGIDDRRAKLVALIEHMDDGIGDVLATLKETGEADDTLVIFTSDNGGQLSVAANNGPLRGGKQETYEGGIRSCTVASWPGRIAPGNATDAIGVSMDLSAALLEAAGAEIPANFDGRSYLPALLGQPCPATQRPIFFSRREGNNRYMGECIWALRDGDWKLVKNSPFQPWELYNLANDPLESNNLAKKNGGQFNRLATMMRKHIQRGGAVPWQKSTTTVP